MSSSTSSTSSRQQQQQPDQTADHTRGEASEHEPTDGESIGTIKGEQNGHNSFSTVIYKISPCPGEEEKEGSPNHSENGKTAPSATSENSSSIERQHEHFTESEVPTSTHYPVIFKVEPFQQQQATNSDHGGDREGSTTETSSPPTPTSLAVNHTNSISTGSLTSSVNSTSAHLNTSNSSTVLYNLTYAHQPSYGTAQPVDHHHHHPHHHQVNHQTHHYAVPGTEPESGGNGHSHQEQQEHHHHHDYHNYHESSNNIQHHVQQQHHHQHQGPTLHWTSDHHGTPMAYIAGNASGMCERVKGREREKDV